MSNDNDNQISNSATSISSRPTTPASTVDTYTEPERKFFNKKQAAKGKAGTAPGAMGDFVKWGKRKNSAVAPAPVQQQEGGGGAGGKNTALSTAQNSDSEDEDEDSDFETRMERREDAVNNLFTEDAPNEIGDEAEHMRSMMQKMVPSRIETDYAMAKHMIFARQDRIDKIKEVLFNVSMVLLVLLLYLVFNSFIFREILSSLYGITHDEWSYDSTVNFHGGVFKVGAGGNIGVNVGVEGGKYPLEMLPKAGDDNVIRLKSAEGAGVGSLSRRMAVVFGNQDLDGYDTAGSEIVGDTFGNLDHHGYGNVSMNSAQGDLLFAWENDAKIGLGTNQPMHKVDIKGDTRILGDLILEGADGGNSTMVVHGGVGGASELRINSDVDVNGYLTGGGILEGFGNIIVPKSDIKAKGLEVKDIVVNDTAIFKDLKVNGALDLSDVVMVVDNTKNAANKSIEQVQVANMNVTTLWFKSMYMQTADGVEYGSVKIDPNKMVNTGEFFQKGTSVFHNDISIIHQDINLTKSVLKGGFSIREGGLDLAGQIMEATGATIAGGFVSSGLTSFTGGVEAVGQTLTLSGSTVAGGFTSSGLTTFTGGMEAVGQTLTLSGSTIAGGFTSSGLTSFTGGVEAVGQTLTLSGSTIAGGFTIDGMVSFVNGLNIKDQTVDAQGATMWGGV
ncbi:hypothetical protein TL16_g12256 [Triparma laevis f. inornata]|uniref:Uncharacterized protein n=1 Tax=Triparma laevis f. inornata TaxID=1714386 RepID=A0A9W7BK07_9STRA|nr:hypothetical protein TL16_g12256 [Triparma laevis f. inornata]